MWETKVKHSFKEEQVKYFKTGSALNLISRMMEG